MHLPSFTPPRDRRFRPQRGVIALSAALIIAYGASTFWSLQRAHDQALRAAGVALESMARSAETGTTRSLSEIDAMLVGFERLVAAMSPTTALDSPALKTVLAQFNAQSLSISDILILDAAGNEVNRANAIADRTRTDRHRAFFTAHRPGAPATLFIGDLEASSVDGRWTIMLSRPLMRNGVMVGVIAAEVPVVAFTDLYDAIAANSDARIALLLDNGVLAAGGPPQSAGIGAIPASAPTLLAAAAHKQAGLIEIAGGSRRWRGAARFPSCSGSSDDCDGSARPRRHPAPVVSRA